MCSDVMKRVRVLFEDLGSSRAKVGIIIEKDSEFLTIKTDHRTEMIPICKIIRVEILN